LPDRAAHQLRDPARVDARGRHQRRQEEAVADEALDDVVGVDAARVLAGAAHERGALVAEVAQRVIVLEDAVVGVVDRRRHLDVGDLRAREPPADGGVAGRALQLEHALDRRRRL
jgi:hypothetical protein